MILQEQISTKNKSKKYQVYENIFNISQFQKEQAEKNSRPGATVQPTEQFVNPVESKFTEEQLIAYNEYIERGYPPEIAEYLVTKA